jgi:mRNA-degrading endonuclease RelE of RelBE toxin-antitoxin system
MLSIKYEDNASTFLKKLKVKTDAKRIMNAIEKLVEKPFPKGAKRVERYHDNKVFRIRRGRHRILYFVDYEHETLRVIKIDKRKDVY